MKNFLQVNRALVAEKNIYLNLNQLPSKNDGGQSCDGNRQSRVMSQSGCSAVDVPMTSYGAPDEHPMSIRSASDGTRWNSRGWKYVAMIFAVLVMSVANIGMAWGTNQTYTIDNPTQDYHSSSPITIIGEYQTSKKVDDVAKAYTNQNRATYIYSNAANIKVVTFRATSSSTGSSGTTNCANVKVLGSSAFVTPSVGDFTATKDGASLASLSSIAITKVQSSHTEISVTFTNPVSAVEISQVSSSAGGYSYVGKISVTYDDAITSPSLFSEGHFTGTTTGTATNSCSWGSFTLNSTTAVVSTKSYYKRNDGNAITYNLATGTTLSAGDVIVLDICGASSSNGGSPGAKSVSITLTNGLTWAFKSTASSAHDVTFVIPTGNALIGEDDFSFTINNTDTRIYGVRVYHAAAGCPYYSFHTGGDDVQTNNTQSCFVNYTSTEEWQLRDYTIPADTKFFVGNRGYWYNSDLGNNHSKSVAKTWAEEMYLARSFDSGDAGGSPKLGQATGATGTIRIYDNSNWNNLNAAFIPDGYVLKVGSNEHAFAFLSSNEYRTDIVEINSTTYDDAISVGVKNNSNGYVATANSQELRHIFFVPSPQWKSSNAKFCIHYWGAGDSRIGFMSEVPGKSGWYEGWLPSGATGFQFERQDPAGSVPSEGNRWTAGDNQTLQDGKNCYTMTATGESWDGTITTSLYSASGKYRIWDNSKSINWYVTFVPYYVLRYNANDGSNAPAQQSIETTASPCQLTVAAGSGMTAPTGYQFLGWNPNESQADAGTKDGNYDPGDTPTMSDDVTLYAVWTPIPVSSITVSPASKTLDVGGTQTLTATVAPATALDKAVTWSTSNGSVATVDESGEVTAVAPGSATITATAHDGSGVTGTCAITVSKITPTKYSFSVDKPVLCGEETATLTLEDSEDGVTYELRSDATHSIADTQKAGTGSALAWTGLGAGNYVVYAVETANYEERQMNSSKITVTTGTATSITTQPTNQEVTVDEEATLTVVAAGTSLSYQWKESATVDGTYSNVASGGTSSSYSVTPAAAGTKWYKCVVTGTCGTETTAARKIVANAAKITPTVTWTTVPSTVYKGGKYAIEVSTNTDASLVAGNLTCTNGTLSGVAVSDGVFTGYLEIATNASSAPTLTLTTSAGSTYAAKTETNDDIELGTCEGGGGSTIYSYTITSISDVTGGSATGGSVDIKGLDETATPIDEVDYYKIGGNFKTDSRHIKITLSGTTLAAGDVITLFDAVTSNDAGTFILYDSEGTARYTYGNISTKNEVTEQKYTITAGDGLVGSSVFYIGRNGSNGRIRTITITRPGGGSSQTTNLTWSGGLVDEGSVDKTVGDADFTYTASSNNSNGAISYSSGTTSVATINISTGEVTIVSAGSTTITATIAESGCYPTKSITYTLTVTASCDDVAAPTELTCSTAGVNSLAFCWTAASNASSYDVYLYSDEECTSPVTPTEGSPYNVSTTSATLTGLTASTTYYCKVQSKGDGEDYCADGGTTDAEDAATTCTSITPTWSYPFSTIGVGITIFPTIGGNTGSGTVTYTSSATSYVEISDDMPKGKAAGSATVTASVAANGNYCSGSVTSGTITVVADQSGLIKQTLPTGKGTSWGTPSAPATSGTYASDITSTSVLTNTTGITIDTDSKGGNDSNGGQTAKITSLSSYDADKYMSLGFTVASGKKLNVSAIYIPVQPVNSNTNTFKAVLTDDDDDTEDIEGIITNVTNGKLTYIKFSSYGSVTGNVTLKIYAYGWTDGYRFGKSIVIEGETESTATLYDISTSATNGTIAVTVGGESASSAEEGATVTITATADNGYSFSSWSVKDEDEGSVDVTSATTNPTTFTMPAKNVTVSATFSPNTYTITYHLNGASWASSAGVAEYTVGTGATLPLAGAMTNVGYTFDGWKDNSSLTGSSVTSISTSDYGNKEYWAKWTENTYTITYNANGGTGTTSATEGHYVTVANNGFTAPDGKVFAGWNTVSGGGGDSYGEGDEIELTANMTLYAQWATDYTITWDASPKLSGVDAKPNLGGGNYTITASVATWTGTLTTSMISTETSGVTITSVAVDNDASPKTITATFNVGASVAGESISFTLDVPANGSYSAKSSTEDFDIDRCTGSSSGSDGVLFSAEFKDSGLGSDNICDAANTPYTFTTTELKSAPTGGSIKAYTTDNVNHMKFATNAISIAGSNGVIQIDLDNPIATNDLFTYVNVNSSSSSAYLRHTSADNTTDQIALTVYNSKEVKVMLPAGYNEKTTLYIVRNNSDFKLHKAAVVRPAFLMLLRDDTPTSDTNLEGTDAELTTENYLTTINGGRAYYTSPSSGNLKIKRNNSKNYINFNNAAGYVKIVLTDALQEGDVIGFDSYNTNDLALTITATRSTTIRTTSQLYTVGSSSPLKGQTTFYLWQNSGSSDFLRGLQIARSGVAGGSSGTDKITPTLTWDTDLTGGVAAETGDADFTHTVTQDKNSLGAITYSSSNTSVATVNASGKVHIAGAGNATITATLAASGCYNQATATYNITVTDNCDDVAGTIETTDLGCSGTQMTVSGHTGEGAGATYQWYKDGASIGGATSATYTATAAGEYYVIVTNKGDGHCAMTSTNTIVIEALSGKQAKRLQTEWYVKNGRRTPDIALVQTGNAKKFIVKNGETVLWDSSDEDKRTGFGGCGFYLGDDEIIYLKGTQDDGSAPSGLTGSTDVTLAIKTVYCDDTYKENTVTIHCQAATTYKEIAFVVDGTKEGDWDAVTSGHADGTALYEYLDSIGTGASNRLFQLSERNIYKTVDDSILREHYSQFDAILITDDPSTQTKPDDVSGKDAYKTKGYVNAMGALIDVRPILTMEAYVSALANWKAKGINGNPSSPNPRQYGMKLECKNHEIFAGLNESSSNIETETVDGVTYWTVLMVDSTKSPYTGVAYNVDTKGDQKPALQGFEAEDVSGLMLLGEISDGTLFAGVERQEEPAARLLLLGVNAKALPNALTPEGKRVIANALSYLCKTNMEDVDDCSTYFTGKAGTTDWGTAGNWSKGVVPNSPMLKVRILKPCVVPTSTKVRISHLDIVVGGASKEINTTPNGSLTIPASSAVVVAGTVNRVKAPYYGLDDLMPTETEDLKIEADEYHTGALIFNNEDGDTKATVEMYSPSYWETVEGKKKKYWSYVGVPIQEVDIPNYFYLGFTYLYDETSGWIKKGDGSVLHPFEGIGLSMQSGHNETFYGTLASTETREITLTKTAEGGNGENLIGNSWTAPIQIANFDATDFGEATATVYVYNTGRDVTEGGSYGGTGSTTPGQWVSVPVETAKDGAYDGLKVIPAMNAFQVNTETETTLTLDYDKLVRKGASTNELNDPMRAPRRQKETTDLEAMMRVRVSGTKTHTDVWLQQDSRFSEEFDNGWEAKYAECDNRSAQFYAQSEIGNMAFLALPDLEGTFLGFAPSRDGNGYRFTFHYVGDEAFYLNDLKLKKSTLISEEESYSFLYEEGDTNRFYISRTRIDAPQTTTGVENTHSGTVKAHKFIYNDKLYIMLNGRVYSAEGQMVK